MCFDCYNTDCEKKENNILHDCDICLDRKQNVYNINTTYCYQHINVCTK